MAMPFLRRRGLFASAVLLLALAAPPSRAEEEPPDPGAGAPEEPPPLAPEEAKRLAKLLEAAAKKRDAQEVVAILEEVGARSHALFHKPLLKLLGHASEEVAIRAAETLRAQECAGEKDAAKLAKCVWKEGWADRANEGRPAVRTRALLAVATLVPEPLDQRSFGEVEKLWRAVVMDPKDELGQVLVDVCRYVRLVKDKRLCRLLAEEIDEPIATAPDSPSNPPEEWWRRRWTLWRQIRAEAVEALETLTGQSFKSTEEAKAWFQANEREFGFRW